MKIYGVTGWKNAGKTGLMERLVKEFGTRGYSVSTVKHTHHGVDLDRAGTDSHRHRSAGARETILASGARMILMQEHRDAPEPSLHEVIARLQPVDLVLVEGYKSEPHPKVEAYRSTTGQPLIAPKDPNIRAVASDTTLDLCRPVFDLDDTGAIADFIQSELDL